MKLMQVCDKCEGGPERIAFINPEHIVSITHGNTSKPEEEELLCAGDYDTVIFTTDNQVYGLNEDIEAVKVQVEKLTDVLIYKDKDGNIRPIS